MASQVELTPCGAMFDIFKRAAHLSHIELCGLVLSSRPLADGRSPQSRAADRSWVSRFIVRAPVGTLQQRYFAEYGTSAARIMSATGPAPAQSHGLHGCNQYGVRSCR